MVVALSRLTPAVSPSMSPRARAEEELLFFEGILEAKRAQVAAAAASEAAAGGSSAGSGAGSGTADAALSGGDATLTSPSSTRPAQRPVGPRAEELVSAVGYKPNVLAGAKTPEGVTAPQFLEFKDRPMSEWPKDWFKDKSFQSLSSGGRPLFPSKAAKDVLRLNAMREWHRDHVKELRQLSIKASCLFAAEKQRMAWLETTGTSKRRAIVWAGKPRGFTSSLVCVSVVLHVLCGRAVTVADTGVVMWLRTQIHRL